MSGSWVVDGSLGISPDVRGAGRMFRPFGSRGAPPNPCWVLPRGGGASRESGSGRPGPDKGDETKRFRGRSVDGAAHVSTRVSTADWCGEGPRKDRDECPRTPSLRRRVEPKLTSLPTRFSNESRNHKGVTFLFSFETREGPAGDPPSDTEVDEFLLGS